MKYSAQDILTELSLDDYFLSLDFIFISKDSTTKWKVYKNPDNNCKYIVGNPKEQWIYKNSQTDAVFKNVFNFVREHNLEIINFNGTANQSNYKILELLNNFLSPGNLEIVKKNNAVKKFKKTIEKKKKLKNTSEFNKTPIFDFDYLINQRKIGIKTINHPLVKGTIFNTIFQFASGHQNINTAFAKYDKNDTIQSLEVYYESQNKSSSLVIGKNIDNDYHKYLWHTNVNANKPISHIFFAESAKDALSYLEILLNSNSDMIKKKKFNPFFISIGGNLDSQQLKENEIYNQLKRLNLSDNIQTFSITDNDKAGGKYDISFTAFIANFILKQKNTVLHKQHFTEFYFDPTITINNWKEAIQNLNSTIDTILPKDNSNFAKYFIIKKNDNNLINATHKLLIPNDISIYPYNDVFMECFNNLIFKSKKILTHKPNLKALNGDLDWNAYLMYKKNPKYFLNRQKRHLNAKIKKQTIALLKNTEQKKKNNELSIN